jgi:RNA polymerase sigma factor (TIGR02999 family)
MAELPTYNGKSAILWQALFAPILKIESPLLKESHSVAPAISFLPIGPFKQLRPVHSIHRRYYVGLMTTSLISVAESGDNTETDALFSALYSELHRLAKRELARQWAPLGLSVTTLLHEAYLDMSARDDLSFPDHARFIGYAARVMRGLIIDHARNRRATKRGGEFSITSLETDVIENHADAKELSLVSDVLDQLAKVEPDLAEIVDLKFFCGFSFSEIAAMQKLSERTVQRKWEKARIYLHHSICVDASA